MSSFIEGVFLSRQDPLGGSLKFAHNLGHLYRGEAYVFSAISHPDEYLRPSFQQALFRQEPYSTEEIREYENLSEISKLELLCFETVLLHEITHQIDTIATPVAAVLHGSQVDEYILLQPFLEYVVDRPDIDISNAIARELFQERTGRLRDALRADGMLESIEEALEITSVFRTVDKLSEAFIQDGWAGRTGQFQLFGQSFKPVTVHGGIHTLRRSEEYRPLTLRSVLESHALANCLRHILWRFAEYPSIGAREMRRYLQSLYPANQAEDYLFLFDAIAATFGYQNFVSMLDQTNDKSLVLLDQIPTLVGVISWTALQGSDPMRRLLIVSHFLNEAIHRGMKFETVLSVLQYLESQPELADSDDALQISRQLVENQMEKLSQLNGDIGSHFDRMLTAVSTELKIRQQRFHSLADPVGLPNSGNFAAYLSVEQVENFATNYQPGEVFYDWQLLRTAIFTRHSSHKRKLIESWIAKN